ncbi:MAG: Dabb family protein [Polyangiales bacterium]
MITHVVLFKFKPSEKEHALPEARARLLAMLGKVPSLRAIEVGTHVGTPDRAADLALITRFDDLDALAAYAVDPVHEEVKRWLGTVIESAQVVDFQSDAAR